MTDALDRAILELDRALRAVAGIHQAERPDPAAGIAEGDLDEQAREHSAALMRVRGARGGRPSRLEHGAHPRARRPPEQLPPPGYCRAWHDRLPPDRQPAVMTCARAEELVRQGGGRLLYMRGV